MRKTIWLGMVLGAVMAAATPVRADITGFVKIAATGDAIPGGGTFTVFGDTPVIDGNTVGFYGASSGGTQAGIYKLSSDTLSVIADKNTAIPNGSGNFTMFTNSFDLKGQDVVFYGSNASCSGAYAMIDGSLIKIADKTTIMPGTSSTFVLFAPGGQAPAFSDSSSKIYLQGISSAGRGVFCYNNGTLSTLADSTMTIPNTARTFDYLGSPCEETGTVYFFGADNASASSCTAAGIYAVTDSGLTALVDRNTPMPGGTGNFQWFNGPALSDDQVAFLGVIFDTLYQNGVYVTTPGGAITCVADTNTPIPGGTGNFYSLGQPALDDGCVAFVAYHSGAYNDVGLYTNLDGALAKVIASGDTLDGKIVSTIGIGSGSLDNGRIAFRVGFTDNTYGVYMAVPEPATFSLLVFGGAMILRRRQK